MKQQYLKTILHYDPDTGIWKWLIRRRGTKDSVGNVNKKTGYLYITIDGKSYAAHRLAFVYMTGDWPKTKWIDHKDTDRINNRWNNLRECTCSQNMANRPKFRNNKSGLKGVCPDPQGGWRSFISVEGKQIYLGSFVSKREASLAYKVAANQYYGKFARS